MSKRFPNIVAYQEDLSESNTGYAGVILGVSTEKSSVSEVQEFNFDQLMLEAGFSKVEKLNFDTLDPLALQVLTPEQISQGLFLKENYNKLPLVDKIKLNLSIEVQRAKEIASSFRTATASMIKSSLSIVNGRIERFLVALGFNITTSSVSGKVINNATGPTPSLQIKISEKSDVTDTGGSYQINRLPTGTQTITVTNPRINKTYSTFPASIVIRDNQKQTNINISLNVPKRRIKGQVMLNNQPLKNGYIQATDGYSTQTIFLNANGEFLDYLYENMYHLTFRDSNYQIKLISNPGTYIDTDHLKVVDTNLDSMIWVR